MRIALFKDSRVSFLQSLTESEINFEELKHMPSGIMASAIYITVAVSSAVAAVLVAWLKSRASRKVILTLKDKQVVHLEGYSVEEVKQLLNMTEVATVIDTNSTSNESDHSLRPTTAEG